MVRARVIKDLKVSRTPRQVAGRLRLKAGDPTAALMTASRPAEGATVSRDAIYRWIYALPKGELVRSGIMLHAERRTRKSRRTVRERTVRIVGRTSIDARPRRRGRPAGAGPWEGDPITGTAGPTTAATMMKRANRSTVILGLPEGKNAPLLSARAATASPFSVPARASPHRLTPTAARGRHCAFHRSGSAGTRRALRADSPGAARGHRLNAGFRPDDPTN